MEIWKRNFKYSPISEYDLSNAPFISNFRVKTKKKEKSEKQKNLPGGESSKVSCVTGGDTHHYTTEELSA